MNDKELVAHQAAQQVENGMLVGLGTGSSANCFIDALARRRQQEGLQVTTVSSSVISAIRAREAGLPLVSIEQVARLDMYVDGADEISPQLTLLKGRGADLVKEKLMARASEVFVVLADRSKLVSRIGEQHPIPVEVIPFAWPMVKRRLEEHGAHADLRPNAGKDGLAVTAHGSLVLDVRFDSALDDASLDRLLNDMPGIVEHGIFRRLANSVLIGHEGQIEHRTRT